MTFQHFMQWLLFRKAFLDELKIYEQTDSYTYKEYNGSYGSILEKEVVSVDLRICKDHMIATVCIK